jgi:hypothetical protein
MRKSAAPVAVAALVLVAMAAVLLSGRDASAAPNLMANGDFATVASLSSWTPVGLNTTITWVSSEDADLNPASGAGQVTSTLSGVNDAIVSQCVDLTLQLAGTYRLAGSYKLASGGGLASIDVTTYTDNACATGATPHGSGTLTPTGTWHTFTDNTTLVITTEQSIKIEIVVHGTAANDAVYFDNIALSNGALDTPPPTATDTPTDTPEYRRPRRIHRCRR